MLFSTVSSESGAGKKITKELAEEEIAVYRYCGILLIFMTIALAGAVILLVHSEGGKHYPGYTIFASFGEGTVEAEVLMNGITGIAVCIMVLAVGSHCIVSSGKMKRQLEKITADEYAECKTMNQRR